MSRLPVSISTREGFEVATPPKKQVKAEHTEKSTNLLGSIRDERAQAKPLLLRLKRQTSESRESQFGQAWELKTPGRPSHGGRERHLRLASSTSCIITRFSEWMWEKNSLVLLAGRGGKEPFWNTTENSVLLNKFCPQEKLVKENLTWWHFIRA